MVTISYIDISDTQGQLTLQCMNLIRLNSELFPDFMVVIATCKNDENLFKNEGAKVFTTLYIDFSDANGQLTL